MKLFALVAFTVLLCGCSVFSGKPQTTAVQACAAYNVALQAALQARLMNRLSAVQIAQITQTDNAITPLCTGTIPTTSQALIARVTAAGLQIEEMLK